MKIITFIGGLGNQIFEYANYQRLKSIFPNEHFYGFYPKSGLNSHNGFELDKDFYVSLPHQSRITTLIGYFFFYSNKVFSHLKINQPLVASRFHQNDLAIYHSDWFGDKKFIPKGFKLKYKINFLSKRNKCILDKIKCHQTVSVHIRRGDFISSKNILNYGGICTENYYQKAIEKIQDTVNSPFYVFFSDDPFWVKQHYDLLNMEIVDWNTGENSYVDMYLMSQCDYMILANSTFSYWAARFNSKVKKVFCPVKWQNGAPVYITPSKWIEIDP